MSRFLRNIIGTLVLTLVLAGCVDTGGQGSSQAAAAIEAYTQALIGKDANRLANLSCAAWEADAKNELDSFAAVTATLEDLSCQEASQEGDFTLVTCTGKIIANYGEEVLEINLADRTYQASMEAGEWRMCGYR